MTAEQCWDVSLSLSNVCSHYTVVTTLQWAKYNQWYNTVWMNWKEWWLLISIQFFFLPFFSVHCTFFFNIGVHLPQSSFFFLMQPGLLCVCYLPQPVHLFNDINLYQIVRIILMNRCVLLPFYMIFADFEFKKLNFFNS